MAIQDLPSEVLLQIFEHLPTTYLYVCLYVCESWLAPATQAYYRNMVFVHHMRWRRGFDQVLSQLNSDEGVKWGIYTRSLTIGDNFMSLFPIFLKNFPNLKILIFNSGIQFSYLVLTIRKAIDEGTISRNIQQITVPVQRTDVYTSYFSICYSFRKTVTHLRINFPAILQQPNYQQPARKFVDFLSEFDQLSHLTVDNMHKSDGALLIFPIMDACPKLISFQFYNLNCSIPEPQVQKILDTTAYNSNFMSLKTLIIHVPALIKSYMQYITTHIPGGQLDTFELVMAETKFDEWMQAGGLEFATWLNSVKNVVIKVDTSSYRMYDTSSAAALKEIGDIPPRDRATRFWQMVQDLSRNRDDVHQQSAIITLYEDDFINIRSHEVALSRVAKNKKMELRYGVHLNAYLNDQDQIDGEEYIGDLQVIVIGSAPSASQTERLIVNLFTRFTGLQHLEVQSVQYSNYCIVKVRKIIINNQYEAITTTATQDQHISISREVITPSLMAVLHEIAPQLSTLTLSNCSFIFDDKLHNADLNLENWANLQALNIQIQSKDYKHGAFYIVLNYVWSNGSAKWYKIDNPPLNDKTTLPLEFTTEDYRTSPLYTSSETAVIVIRRLVEGVCKLKLIHDFTTIKF